MKLKLKHFRKIVMKLKILLNSLSLPIYQHQFLENLKIKFKKVDYCLLNRLQLNRNYKKEVLKHLRKKIKACKIISYKIIKIIHLMMKIIVIRLLTLNDPIAKSIAIYNF